MVTLSAGGWKANQMRDSRVTLRHSRHGKGSVLPTDVDTGDGLCNPSPTKIHLESSTRTPLDLLISLRPITQNVHKSANQDNPPTAEQRATGASRCVVMHLLRCKS